MALISTSTYKCILTSFLIFVLILYFSFQYKSFLNEIKFDSSNKTKDFEALYEQAKFKINKTVALVFYGRLPQVSILLRYLDKNLKINGGILDKIVFAVKTQSEDALNYLNEHIKKNNSTYYERLDFPNNTNFIDIYSKLYDDDLVFKIDDDIVFISNGTFESMVKEYITKDLLVLSANVVNHPLLSHVHARLRAILPFFEVKPLVWERRENINELDKTVAAGYTYDEKPYGWWADGRCAALAHESLFYHLKNNNLKVYDFNIWDFHTSKYSRWSINFILMRGKYVNNIGKSFADDSDEVIISSKLPEKFEKHSYALGSAVVSHYSYFSQIEYLHRTDILQKYDNYSKIYLNI